jgi:hypothetical protein
MPFRDRSLLAATGTGRPAGAPVGAALKRGVGGMDSCRLEVVGWTDARGVFSTTFCRGVSIVSSDSTGAVARGVVGEVGMVVVEALVGVVGTTGASSGIGAAMDGGVATLDGSGDIRSIILSSVL